MNLRNTLFVLICLCGQGFHGKPVAWEQVNRQRVEETRYVASLQSLYLRDLEEQRGRVFLKLSYRRKAKSHKHQEQEELLWDAIKKQPKELTIKLLYLELPTISASCGVKRYMHYIRFLLTKTHKQRSLNQFFLLDLFLFTLLIFLSICKWQLNEHLLFLTLP